MIEDPLLTNALWLGYLVLAIASVRWATLFLYRSALPRAARVWRGLRHSGLGRAAAGLGARFERTRPGAAGFFRARFAVDRFSGWPLTVAGTVAVVMSISFIAVAQGVRRSDVYGAYDDAILSVLSELRAEPLLSVFIWITGLGSNAAFAAAVLVACGFLWAGRHSHLLLGLWVAVLGSQITLWAAKFGFNRTRPEFLADVTASSPSFPSGHTAGSVAIYGYIAYAVTCLVANSGIRFEILFWAVVGIALIGFSRVYLHVHYPTDVIAGLFLGALWLMAGCTVAQWRRSVAKQAV